MSSEDNIKQKNENFKLQEISTYIGMEYNAIWQ